MDEIKLNRWRDSFSTEAGKLQIEFDIVFQDSEISDSYILDVDEQTQNLTLVIKNEALPVEIKERLHKLLIETMPEDSV